jgi:hexulose-6-phosphate isomerase
MKNQIGFMQGRLSPLVNGKIQAFPWECWRNEFASAKKIEIFLMEWTLDQENLYENPFMTEEGQAEIKKLSSQYGVKISSLTGDCFMQAPFYKAINDKYERLKDYENIIKACGVLGVTYVVFPLVDNGALKSDEEEKFLIVELLARVNLLKENKVKVVFESDYSPLRLKEFIEKLPVDYFGINYDLGNSASLGFEPKAEIKAYGDRILNVHIKDRVFGGTTVPLGLGDVNFSTVFDGLKSIQYAGNFILQTARSPEGEHEQYLIKFSQFVKERLDKWN